VKLIPVSADVTRQPRTIVVCFDHDQQTIPGPRKRAAMILQWNDGRDSSAVKS
jgi:hypothetical protein